jgi:O-Antigen ligase
MSHQVGVQTRVAAPWRLPRSTPRPPFALFAPALGLLLGGYLFFDRAFAYLHIPGTPVFLGEIVLAIGVYEAVRARPPWYYLVATSTLLKILLAFMGICFIRFLIDFPVYRLDALRDSSIWYYGAFALLVSAAACCDPTFAPRLLGWYWRILPWFLLWAPVAIVVNQSKALAAISVPGSSTPINSFKIGDLQVHVALALAFLWLGGGRFAGARRSRHLVTLLSTIGMLTLLMAGSQNRGGLLASVVVLTIALAYLSPGRRRRVVVAVVGGLAVAVALVMLLDLRLQGDRRDISLQQVTTNIKSVFGQEAGSELSGNVAWREDYWRQVVKDSLAAENRLHGLGFGPLLPSRYEVPVEEDNPQPLRNAHNSHLTILARAGVPAFALWVLLWLAWIGLLAGWIRRRPGGVQDPGAAVAVWLLVAGPAFLINAFFDPVLEGPQGGVWLFTLLGLGAALLRRHEATS